MLTELVDRMLLAVMGSSVSEIELHADGFRVRLVRESGARPRPGPGPAPALPRSDAPPADAAPVAARADARHIVTAGMHGTFYRASAPDQPALVQVGQRVETGQQLGLIESMKMLHGVETDVGGRVAEVLADGGAAVEPGAALFAIEPEGDGDV